MKSPSSFNQARSAFKNHNKGGFFGVKYDEFHDRIRVGGCFALGF